jgi:hypothetical protein
MRPPLFAREGCFMFVSSVRRRMVFGVTPPRCGFDVFFRRILWLLVACGLSIGEPLCVMAAPTSRQRSTINTLKRKATRVETQATRNEIDSAEDELREILGEYDRLLAESAREPGLIPLLEPLYAQLRSPHARLELEGISLPPLRSPREAGNGPLTDLTDVGEADPERLEVVMATGSETVHFARDLAPVLVERCTGCHGDGQQNAGQLNLSNFDGLLRGGENGSILVPGEPAESLLLGKLRGTAEGDRMPRRQPPLDEEVIARFETWIAEGATFDGRDTRAHLADVAALDRALRASQEELRQQRDVLARQNWRLGFPSLEPSEARTKNFTLLGTVGERTLADVGRQAEKVLSRVADLLKIPPERPVVRGGITLLVVASRYDYSEFGKMVEQRQLPSDWRGHWRYTVIDAYAVVLVGKSDGEPNETLLAQLIAALHLASLGEETPSWFAEGAARMAVARIAPRDARIVEWDWQVPGLLRAMNRPDDFLEGRLGPELTDLASYRFVRFLANRDARRFQGLLQSLRAGELFESAFVAHYQASPEELAPAWVSFEARGSRRR